MKKLRNIFKIIMALTVLSIFFYSILLFHTNQSIQLVDSSLQKFTDKHTLTSFLSYEKSLMAATVKATQLTEKRLEKNQIQSVSECIQRENISNTSFPKKRLPRVDARVLLLYDKDATHTAKGVKNILDSLRIAVDALKYRENKSIPLTNNKVLNVIIIGFIALVVVMALCGLI